MGTTRMGRFWDRRAREDAFHFVDNRVPYRESDEAAFWSGGEADLDTLLSAVGARIEGGDRVLEIGCGVGRLTRPIATRAAEVTALDVSAEMLALARQHNPGLGNVIWIHGDGTSLDAVSDASVDVCISHVVFQHIPDPAITLGYVCEMGRVLKPGGWAAFQVSNDPSIHRASTYGSPLARARTRVLVLARRRPGGQTDPAWLGSAVDLDELREAADSGGMDVETLAGEGTQFCLVLTRRRPGTAQR